MDLINEKGELALTLIWQTWHATIRLPNASIMPDIIGFGNFLPSYLKSQSITLRTPLKFKLSLSIHDGKVKNQALKAYNPY